MAEQFRVGPSLAWYGNPTTASGLTFIGKTRGDTVVEPNVNIAMAQTDQKGSTPIAQGVWFTGVSPVVTIPLVDEEKAKMEAYMAGASTQTANSKTALTFGAGISKVALADIGTLFLQPVAEVDQGTNGIDAPNGVWLPAAIANQYGQITFNRPDGDDTLNPHEVQFAGLLREQDHGSNDIPDDARTMFRGSPDALGLNWQVSDPTQYL